MRTFSNMRSRDFAPSTKGTNSRQVISGRLASRQFGLHGVGVGADAKEQVRARYDAVSGERTVLDASPQEKTFRSGNLSPDGRTTEDPGVSYPEVRQVRFARVGGTIMQTPETNPDGYRRAAPIHYAEGLKGNLLIIHGTGENNTHLQIVEGLVDRLIELGKRFDYMAYPNRDHGLREGPGTVVHLRMHMARYLIEHLPPGPH